MTVANTKQPISLERFVLSIPGIDTIGYFAHCSGLEVDVSVYDYHEGGNNDFVHHLPGEVRYPNLILSRGLTNEDAIAKWFNATASKPELKEITITLKSGSVERKWTFADAFPVRWVGPNGDASGGIATETLEIAHSGMKAA
ncbi:MAG TPA: phage tail protein [Gaiellaceae bacterium]|nr:phage tail protein [Gaiellaceae bacterium]